MGSRFSLSARLAARALPVLFLGASAIPGASQQAPAPEPARAPLRIAFVGDILPEAHWRQPPLPPDKLFDAVRARLAAADIVVGNLEEPLTDWPEVTRHKRRASIAAGRDFVLRAVSFEAAPALRSGGLRVLALANNHTMDYTERGLFDTIARLESVGIVPVGGGANREEAERVRVVEAGGWRAGFLSFSDVVPPGYAAEDNRPGIASSKDAARVRAAVAAARRAADFVIVVFHWGVQNARQPSPRQRALAREAQRAGADLILGAHPHVLQGVGCLGRAPVVYSAGNFVFPSSRNGAQQSAIFEIELTGGETASVRVVPVVLDADGVPHLAEPARREAILAEMKKLSAPLGLQLGSDSGSCPPPEPPPAPRKKRTKKP